MSYINLQIIKVKQNIGTFFITKMTPKVLHRIANKNLSRLKDIENGIQREIQKEKVQEIREYLKLTDATFPNSIILAIQNNPLESDAPSFRLSEDETSLSISLSPDTANILDGQHRLNGFDEDNDSFELPVSIFLDISLGEQAKIFAKINSTQKKVDLSLVYDLFGITDDRSPEKVAFHIVRHLNSEEGSAWKGKIKTLIDRSGDIAQGSMAKFFHKELFEKEEVFSRLYKKERDSDIKNILMNYFNAIKDAFPEEWKNEDRAHVLTKTTGFNGFMMFLISLVKIAEKNKSPLSKDFFSKYIGLARKDFKPFTNINYPSGATGQNKIRNILRSTLTDDEKNIANIH